MTSHMMREIQASEAKAKLLQILDDVERGETVIITRRGKRIARVVPEAERRQAEIDRAVENIRALGRTTGKMSVKEIIETIREGRKY